MAPSGCENPLNIPNHNEKWYSFVGVKPIDTAFLETYLTAIPELTLGMHVCLRRRNKIENLNSNNIICSNPFSGEKHYGQAGFVVSNETISKFYSQNLKWVLGSLVCTKCSVRLFKAQSKFEKKFGHEKLELCCNPFDKSPHPAGKNSRRVTPELTDIYKTVSDNIKPGGFLCNASRTKLYKKGKKNKEIKEMTDISNGHGKDRPRLR